MITSEMITIDDKQFVRHYSSNNKYIKKVGTNEIYAEAVDLVPCFYIYEETNEDIEIINEKEVDANA